MKVKERANYQIDTLRDSLFFPYTRKALKNPPSFLEELVKSHGSVVKVKIARTRYLILQHPDLIKHILVDNHKAYEKVGITTILRYFFGSGLVTSNGEEWAHKRKIIQPAFHKQRLSNLLEVIDEETTKLVKRLNQYPSNNPINITDEMLRLNISIITRSLFGGTTKKERILLFEVLSKLTSFATKRISSIVKTPMGWPTAANKEFQKDCKEFDGIIYSLIERRKKHRSASNPVSYNDLLAMLLDDYENLESLQFNQQLRDDITTIFMAGHDTTAQTLSWLFYEVARNPGIGKELYDEVQENINPGPLDIDTLSKMLYTEQVIQETLRNYPSIIAVQRKPISEDYFHGIKVDSSTNILINIYGMHHHPQYWDNPQSFDPSRFDSSKSEPLNPNVYMPFGAGPRRCIGSNFAMMTIRAVLTKLIANFSFTVPENFMPVIEPNISLKAKGGIRLKINRL